MSEPQTNISSRDRLLSRLKDRNVGKDYPDDESIYNQIIDDYDDYDKRISTYEKHENELVDLFTRDKRSTAFLMEWKNGSDPIAALIKMYGDELRAALDDPEKIEAIKQANKDYAERIAESEKYDKQYDQNIEESKATLNQLQEEKGWTDDDVDNIMVFLIGVMKDAILGKFSKETILMGYKAVNHDSDVEAAAHEGEIRGKNAKIDAKLRKRKDSDGLPQIGGKNQNASSKPNRSIFDIAKGAM